MLSCGYCNHLAYVSKLSQYAATTIYTKRVFLEVPCGKEAIRRSKKFSLDQPVGHRMPIRLPGSVQVAQAGIKTKLFLIRTSNFLIATEILLLETFTF